jgi:hypothetical protein
MPGKWQVGVFGVVEPYNYKENMSRFTTQLYHHSINTLEGHLS